MISFFSPRRLPPGHVIGKIDVPWRGEVVARDRLRREAAQAFVGDVVPGRARQQDRVQPDYALLGRVTSGLDVVERIGRVPTNSQTEAPLRRVVIRRITISP